jgi:uncharacterized protein (TIGR03435 family)
MKSICFLLLLVANAAGQTSSFDAASIKPNDSGPGPSSMRTTAGHLSMQNVSLKKMILNAYGIPDDRRYAVIGPDWLESGSFDLEATFPADTQPVQIRTMLQGFLTSRFKMVARKDTRQLPNYTLVVAKGGAKITPDEAGKSQTSGGNGSFTATKTTMAHFADLIARVAGLPVVDGTGLAGVYTFKLEWSPTAGLNVSADSTPSAGPSIFTALEEQLGLHLQSGKGPVEVVVIDSMEKMPTEN